MSESEQCKHNEQMSERMSLALDGWLEADGQRRLQRHLATCPACQTEWEAMRRTATLFEQADMVGPPLGFAIRVERRLAEKRRKRRRLFGGVAVLTGSLSLAGMTVAAMLVIISGLAAWHWLGALPTVQQGTSAISQVASGVGLMGKGASLFLGDLLRRYGPPLVLLIGIGLMFLAGIWAWLFARRPNGYHHNGYA